MSRNGFQKKEGILSFMNSSIQTLVNHFQIEMLGKSPSSVRDWDILKHLITKLNQKSLSGAVQLTHFMLSMSNKIQVILADTPLPKELFSVIILNIITREAGEH